jgi:hypothetical protein
VSEDESAKVRALRAEIRMMQLALEERNKQLNAWGHVWCTGGCEGGMKDKSFLDEETIARAELQVRRLRAYWINYRHRGENKLCQGCSICRPTRGLLELIMGVFR